jgi:CBS domain-containing protein
VNKYENAYAFIKQWKDENVYSFTTSGELNTFHDSIFKKVYHEAYQIISSNHGEPPCHFSWFVVGSAGRSEQGFISDQDHGIIYEKNNQEAAQYFLLLGEELSKGLNAVGYPFCDGKVMSSNPLWCKSFHEWKEQLNQWTFEESLDSIRYLQIFYDARVLIGNTDYIAQLKQIVLNHHYQNPMILKRFLDNIRYIKKSVGVFGQLYVQQNGRYEGSIDLKHSAFLPYVNAIRLLAIKEGIFESSTLGRLTRLREQKQYDKELINYQGNFQLLLHYRLFSFHKKNSYEDTHFLNIRNMKSSEKRTIKQLLKDGEKLHHFVQKHIEKGC